MIDRERLQVLALNLEACLAEVREVLNQLPQTAPPPQRGHKGSAANNRVNITAAFIKTLPKSEKEYDILDTEIPGFGVRVRRQAVSFCVRKRLTSNGSPTRHTLGRFPVMTVEQARAEALAWLRAQAAAVEAA